MDSNEWNDWIDLPSLKSIDLGEYALCGRRYDSSCALTMRSMKQVCWILNNRSTNSYFNYQSLPAQLWKLPIGNIRKCVINAKNINLDIPNVENVQLRRSFRFVQAKTISSMI